MVIVLLTLRPYRERDTSEQPQGPGEDPYGRQLAEKETPREAREGAGLDVVNEQGKKPQLPRPQDALELSGVFQVSGTPLSVL